MKETTKSLKRLVNTNDASVPVTKKDGGTFMLSPKASIKLDAAKLGTLPKGVVLR